MSIIERLQRATEGSRELDAEVYIEIHKFKTARCLSLYDGDSIDCHLGTAVLRHTVDNVAVLIFKFPHFTTSIDAALTLVPEGCSVHLHIMPREIGHKAEVGIGHEGLSKTAALALTIAALKAREKEGK